MAGLNPPWTQGVDPDAGEVLNWEIMPDTAQPCSLCLHDLPTRKLLLALEWCRSRLGPEIDGDHPDGTWTYTELPGLGTVFTLPSSEIIFEMRMVEPWNQ